MITDSLLFKYLSAETSPKENHEIESWLQQDARHQTHLNDLRQIFVAKEPGYEEIDQQANEDWMLLEQKIQRAAPIKHKHTLVTPRIRWAISVAAMLILAIGLSMIWINPGHTLFVPSNHEARTFTLADGSEVTLSPGSRLKQSRRFTKGERSVTISGEAQFNVKKMTDNPFVVNTGPAKIRVTGTVFKVSAHKDTDEVEVLVESGNVLFYNSEVLTEDGFSVGLTAGEKGVYSSTRKSLDKINQYAMNSIP